MSPKPRLLRWLAGAALVTAVVVVLPLPPASAVQAEASPWTEPVKVSAATDGGKDWFPDVGADDFGNVHIVWNWALIKDLPGDLGALFYSRWGASGWTPQSDVAVIWNGHALRSSLAVDAAGRLHMIYKGFGKLDSSLVWNGSGPEDLWYTSAPGAFAHAVAEWSTPRRMTRGSTGYFSDLAIDSNGTLHAIWTEADGKGAYGLYYAHSTDGGSTWSERAALEDEHLVWWYRAQLRVDRYDRLHVVWELANPGLGSESYGFGTTAGARYALSEDGGATWQTHTFESFRSPRNTDPLDQVLPPGPQQPAIGIDGTGTLMLVFREPGTNRILYRISVDGAHWTAPTALPGVGGGPHRPFDTFDMATDSAGRLHLAMAAYPSGSTILGLLHLTWDGQSWSQPAVVAAPPPLPEYPKLAVEKGSRLHLVWFGGDKMTDRTPVGIWYSTLETDAPEMLSAARPVPTPAPPPAPPAPTPVPEVRAAGALSLEPPAPLVVEPAVPDTSPAWLKALREEPLLPIYVAGGVVLLFLGGVMFLALDAGRLLYDRLRPRERTRT